MSKWSMRLTLCMCVLAHVKGQSNHKLKLFDGSNSQGSHLFIDNYIGNLQSVGFNDLTSSWCVVQGIWLVYEHPNYNKGMLGASGFNWGFDFCQDLPMSLNNLVTSVRYGGSPFNFQEDGLNIYENEWFQENEVYATASSPNFSPFKNAGSLIVTGRSAWTLYEYSNYSGHRVCVTPLDIVISSPGFYTKPEEFGFYGRTIRSVRKGCWSDRTTYPVMTPEPAKLYSSNVQRNNTVKE